MAAARVDRSAIAKVAVVIALALVAIVLASLALQRGAPAERTGGAGGAAGGPTPTGTSTPPPEPEPAAPSAAPVEVFAAAVDDETAWIGELGSCGAASVTMQISEDGGLSWQPIEWNDIDLAELLTVRMIDGSQSDIAYRDGATCDPAGARTFTSGVGWQDSADSLAASSWLERETGEVVIDGAPADAPCATPVQVVDGGESDLVLCDDSTVHERAGGAWRSASVPGAIAVAGDEGTLALAAVGVEGCPGTAVVALPRPLADGVEPELRGCASDSTAPARTALAIVGDAVWFTDPTGSRRSPDGGRTW
jgi:hypothetical protein